MAKEIAITDRAAEKIRKLLTDAPEGNGLRVEVVEGGCSGLEYKLAIGFPEAEDKVFEKNGARREESPSSERQRDGLQGRIDAIGVRVQQS